MAQGIRLCDGFHSIAKINSFERISNLILLFSLSLWERAGVRGEARRTKS
jgi:hypothetical protein